MDGVAQSFSSFLPTSKPIPKGAVSLIAKVYTLFLLNKKPFLSLGGWDWEEVLGACTVAQR